MEVSNTTLIHCPYHPDDYIHRIAAELGEERELYCIECLISAKGTGPGPKLINFKDFIEEAANFYEQNRVRVSQTLETPSEFLDVLASQEESLEIFSKKIEDEKRKVSIQFDELLKYVTKLIADKKAEYLLALDKQLLNYRHGFIFFDKMLKKSYPKDDIANLFPSKEELQKKLNKIQSPSQLEIFVKGIKEDLHEAEILQLDENKFVSEARLELLQKLSKKLTDIKNESPRFVECSDNMEKLKTEFETALGKFIGSAFEIADPVDDLTFAMSEGGAKSKIIKPNDFAMIKKWLPSEFKNKRLKLIYQGTRDGMNPQTFHTNCDKKGPTITLLKLSTGKVIGGFIDQSWESRNAYINSTKAFLFSVTAKAKYEIISGNSVYAAYDTPNNGPTFGGGHDIRLHGNFSVTNCSRHTYNFPSPQEFAGGTQFAVNEIEVFSIH